MWTLPSQISLASLLGSCLSTGGVAISSADLQGRRMMSRDSPAFCTSNFDKTERVRRDKGGEAGREGRGWGCLGLEEALTADLPLNADVAWSRVKQGCSPVVPHTVVTSLWLPPCALPARC